MLGARLLGAHGRAARPATSGSIAGSTSVYTRSLRWSLAHRGAIVAISVLTFATTFPLAQTTSAARSCRPRTRESSSSRWMRRKARRWPAWRRSSRRSASGSRPCPAWRTSCRRSSSGSTTRTCWCSSKPLDERSVTQEADRDGGARGDAALSRPTGRPSSSSPPIGGGENAAWPILVNLYGPDLRRLSDYAVTAERAAARAAAVHRRQGARQPRQPGGARHRRPPAGRRSRRARARTWRARCG